MTHPSRGHARLFGSALLTACLILALINFPAYVLAALCILGSCAVLAAGWWLVECVAEDRAYDRDHDLP